jgi:hypothetical protein
MHRLVKSTLALGLIGMFAPSLASAQDAIVVDVTYLYQQPQTTYYTVPMYQPTDRWGNLVSTSIQRTAPFLRRSRTAAIHAGRRTRRVATRATEFYLEWHPVSWIAQDLGILDRERVLRFLSGDD